MAIQFIVDFNERNSKVGSALHRLEQSEESVPINYGARSQVMGRRCEQESKGWL